MKKTTRLFAAAAIAAVGLVAMGCKNGLINQDLLADYTENVGSSFSESVVLGKKIENPFSLTNARAAGVTEPANYAYFRCRSDEIEKIEWLKNTYGELEIIPMDREIVTGGTYYDDPDIDEGNECPWIYFMDRLDVLATIEEQGFLTEVLEELYVSDEALSEIEEGYSANDEPESADGRWLFFGNTKIKPEGTVEVYDVNLRRNVSVPDVQITMRQLIISSSAQTDKKGKFSIPYGFDTRWGNISLRITFANNNVTLHGENGNDWFQFITNAYYTASSVSPSSAKDISVKISGDNRQTRMALIMVAAYTYMEYAVSEGLVLPVSLNVWVLGNDVPGAITLMGRYMMMNLNVPVSMLVGGCTGNVPAAFLTLIGGQLTASLFPDIIIGTKGLVYTSYIDSDGNSHPANYSTLLTGYVFHEFAHASHFTGMGGLQDSCSYWFNEYMDMGGGFVEKWFNGKSAFEDCYTDTPRIQLIETWGNFVEYYLLEKYFPDKQLPVTLETIESITTLACYKHLFVPKGMYYLVDSKIDTSVKDYCMGYTVSQLSKTLCDKNVNSLYTFAVKLDKIGKKDEAENIYKTLLHGRTK